MKTAWPSRPALASLLVLLLLHGGCSSCFDKGPVEDAVTQAVATLNAAIQSLDQASADWQNVLRDAQAKLTRDAQSTIRTEISNTLQRAIQASQTNVACVVDMLRLRVREELVRIRARLLHQPVPAREPVVCSAVPDQIDMSLDPERRTLVTFNGYNFDADTPLTVWLDNGGSRADVTASLDRQSFYGMTLNLGNLSPSGIKPTRESRRVVVEWQGRTLSSIPVTWSAPECEHKPFTLPPSAMTLPATLQQGFANFGSHPAHVRLEVIPLYTRELAAAVVNFWVSEVGGDARFGASETHRLYTPEPGWAIQSIPRFTPAEYDYLHREGDPFADTAAVGRGWVNTVTFSGFRGDPANPKAEVGFYELQIQLVRTEGCVSTPVSPTTPTTTTATTLLGGGHGQNQVPSSIKVDSATYGANCGALSGNDTAHLAGACNGLPTCDYTVDYTVIGDPRKGCAKDYQVSYHCRFDPAPRTVTVPAEAGFRKVAHLSCE